MLDKSVYKWNVVAYKEISLHSLHFETSFFKDKCARGVFIASLGFQHWGVLSQFLPPFSFCLSSAGHSLPINTPFSGFRSCAQADRSPRAHRHVPLSRLPVLHASPLQLPLLHPGWRSLPCISRGSLAISGDPRWGLPGAGGHERKKNLREQNAWKFTVLSIPRQISYFANRPYT